MPRLVLLQHREDARRSLQEEAEGGNRSGRYNHESKQAHQHEEIAAHRFEVSARYTGPNDHRESLAPPEPGLHGKRDDPSVRHAQIVPRGALRDK